MTAKKKVSKTPKPSVAKSSSSRKPKTMADLLAQYGEMKSPKVGDTVEGTIVDITPRMVHVDIGGKTDAVVAEKAFLEAKDYIRTLKVGDKVKARVLIAESRDGNSILSFRHSARESVWKKIEKLKKEKKPVTVRVKNLVSAGLNIDIKGVGGFLPTSQLGKDAAKNPDGLVGGQLRVIIIDTDKSANRIIVSERAISEKGQIENLEKALAKIKEGEVYEGVVISVTNFGCFVEISVGSGKSKVSLEGLVHVSELSWKKVENPSSVVKPGDKVKVAVLSPGRKGRLSLSMKHAQKDPWQESAVKIKKDAQMKGKVTKQSDLGIFVEVMPGIEGLVHITKVPPATKYDRGQEVNVYVEDIDTKERKLSLGLVLTAKPVGYR